MNFQIQPETNLDWVSGSDLAAKQRRLAFLRLLMMGEPDIA